MSSRLCSLSVLVTFVTLGIASGLMAEEVSQKVEFQSSELNVRMMGRTAITNPIGSKSQTSIPREFMGIEQSPLVKMHYLLTSGAGLWQRGS
jgi:hypothetical protein